MPEDLDKAENTATGETLEVAYAGTAKYSSFFWNRGQDGNAAYILNDTDYEKLKEGLPEELTLRHVLFDLAEEGDAYGFSKKLYEEYCTSVPDNMRVMGNFDEYRASVDEGYEYGETVELYADRPEMEVDWKYAPVFVPLPGKDFHFNLCCVITGICLCGIDLSGSCRSDWVYKKCDGSLQEQAGSGRCPEIRGRQKLFDWRFKDADKESICTSDCYSNRHNVCLLYARLVAE